MSAAKVDLVYKVWHAGGRDWRWEVRKRGTSGNALNGGVESTAGAAEIAAAKAAVIIRNEAAAEWRDA